MWLNLICYASILIFVFGFIAKARKYATMPLHLRWELYPVAHEKKRPYGGSYFEGLNWWRKPREKSLLRDLKYIGQELSFFREYFRRNRGFWYFVYPFHIGFYLLVLWLVLLGYGAILILSDLSIAAHSLSTWGRIIYFLTLIAGVTGFIIGAIGTSGLILKRVIDKELRFYTTPVDYFSLLLVLAVFVSGLYAWYFYDQTFSIIRDHIKSLFTFSPPVNMNPATTTFLVLTSLFFAYMPFTRMMHYLAKFFTFHKVRWDDEPNLRGSKIEKKVIELLNQRVTWSAPHIQSGKKWVEIATEVKFPSETGGSK